MIREERLKEQTWVHLNTGMKEDPELGSDPGSWNGKRRVTKGRATNAQNTGCQSVEAQPGTT